MSDMYMVREGKIKGQGRYSGPNKNHIDWQPGSSDAWRADKEQASVVAKVTYGRIVKVTTRPARKPPVVEVRSEGLDELFIDGKYVCAESMARPGYVHLTPKELAVRIKEALGV